MARNSHQLLATQILLLSSTPLLAQGVVTTRPVSEQATAVGRAMEERREYLRSVEATAEQRKRFENLVQTYDRRYEQGHTDDANALIPDIISSYTSSPFAFDEGSRWRGQGGIDQLSQFVNRLLQRNQKGAALKIIQASPAVSPAECARLFPPNAAADKDHLQFTDMVWKLAESNDYWLWVYFRYLGQTPRARQLAIPADELVKKMEAAVRQDPTDLRSARRYAVAVAASTAHRPTAEAHLQIDRGGKCDWMGDICRPPNASDYLTLAAVILSTNSPEGTVRLLRAGLNAPITQADDAYCKSIRLRSSVMVSSTNEQMIRGQMKSELIRCLKLAGHADEAVDMMRQEGSLPRGREAGQLDRGKANPVFEKAILDAAATRGDSPDYWMDRADYYAMRGDNAAAETAYEQAMGVAKPEGTERAVTKSWVLRRYVDFIAYNKRDVLAGYEKLWSESKGYPAERVCRLIFDYRPAMEKSDCATGDDERLWKALSDTPTWTIVQMRIIQKMIRYPGAWPQDRVIVEAIGLARGLDTTRAAALAQALTMTANEATWRKDDAAAQRLYGRVVETLEEAMPRAKGDRRGADYLADPAWLRRTLLGAYRQQRAWDKMLRLYPEGDAAAREYPIRELAVAAAMVGDRSLAMRHWDRSLSSRPDKPTVLALAEAGCRDELIARARRSLASAPGDEGARDVLTWVGAPTTQPK